LGDVLFVSFPYKLRYNINCQQPSKDKVPNRNAKISRKNAGLKNYKYPNSNSFFQRGIFIS
jgi:hypothetical protein